MAQAKIQHNYHGQLLCRRATETGAVGSGVEVILAGPDFKPEPGKVQILNGYLNTGFEFTT